MKIIDGWLDTAIEINCKHKSMARYGYMPTMIVLHGTAGGSSAENVASWLQTSDVQASAHFVIGPDGHVVQCVSCNAAAWANGVLTPGHAPYLPQLVNPNLYTISIEHVKASTDNSNQLTQPQQDASFKLIECLCDTYKIPKRPADANGGILSHADLDPVNRSRCPGPYPHDQLYAYLNRSKNMPQYGPGSNDFNSWFVDQGDGTWRCKKNGAIVMGGNLSYYRSLSRDGASLPIIGLPLESEQYHNDDGYYWSSQMFERATIYYDPEHKKDQPPGSGTSYLAHVNPPQTVVVSELPEAIIADIQALKAACDKLAEDAQI